MIFIIILATTFTLSLMAEEEQQVAQPETMKPEAVQSEKIESETVEPEIVNEEQPTEEETIPLPPVPVNTQMEVVVPSVEEEAAQPKGIDTVSLEDNQGNWLYKRIWWERAEDRYGKIRALVDKIWDMRSSFFVKHTELDRKVLDPFFLSIGINQGELQIIINEYIEFLEKKREMQGELNERDRERFAMLETEQESLKQLKIDIDSIASLDHALEDALALLMEQINRVRQLENQAWGAFKEIAHILNDIRARELYYVIEGIARNIKNIGTYVENDFLNHFNKLTAQTQKKVDVVKQQIDALKEKGIDFKTQAERALEQERLEKQRAAELALQEEEEEAPKQKQSWFGWLISLPKAMVNFVWYVIQWPYKMIFGSRS